MSFLFTGRGREDRELAEGNRRFRERIARDINDQATLNRQGELSGHRRRSGWLLLAAVTVFILLAAFVRGGSETLTIARSCTEPALAVDSTSVDARSTFYVRSTGPQDASYILTVAGEPVQGDADRALSFTSTPSGPAYSLTDCVSPTFLVPTPVEPGPFELVLLRYDAAGAVPVASLDMTVVG